MASLVLSAAGAAIGGPVGGAIGSLVGRQIDRSFGLSPAERIRDLRFPSSQYGDPIPRIIGQMRVAGVVLWSAKPVATATISKTGSEQGLSVSFAYGLSSGPIRQIGSIWADGRLIRDGQGRQDVPFDLNLHAGDEDQLSDPLIASILGEAEAPAFRGIAYLVFENFDLSSFGNRLPLITVEVDAGGDELSAERVLSDGLALTAPSHGLEHELTGYALTGDDVKAALAPLCTALQPSFAFAGRAWTLDRSPISHVVARHLWTLGSERETINSVDSSELQTKVSVRYFDPAQDFSASEKSAKVPGPERLNRVELPAAMTGEQAKALAFERLSDVALSSAANWLNLPLRYSSINLGDRVACEGELSRPYRVCAKVLKGSELSLQLRLDRARVQIAASDPGGVASQKVLQRKPLGLSLLELPGSAGSVGAALLVSGGHEPFRSLAVRVSCNGIEQELSSAIRPAACGTLLEAVDVGVSELMDHQHTIHVEFEQDPMLVSVDEAALLAGANLLHVGGECIRFSRALPLGASRYELSGLIRGCFDTVATAPHELGALVHVLDASTYRTFQIEPGQLGATFEARLYGPDQATADASLTVHGVAQRPWAPAHIETSTSANGLQISWVRRGRDGQAWLDGVDAPIGASREAYTVSLLGQEDRRLDFETSAPDLFVSTASLAVLGSRPWQLEVRQLGDLAPGNIGNHTIA